ncbi:MAG: hypothetical protein WDN26_03125 [Chitinophagaceae bacterium]
MKKQVFGSLLATFFLAATLFSCQKDASTSKDNFDTEASEQSDDQSEFAAQIDASANETSAVLEAAGTIAQRGEDIQTIICNATVVVDSISNIRTLTITYNGADCLGQFSRTGTILVSIPAGVHWKNAGATITLQYQNMVITRIADNKSITINGSHNITNVSGGLLYNLPNLSSITHTITSSGMTVKFPNSDVRTWQVAKQRVFTYNNGVVITTTGTHTEGTVTGIAEWGISRSGRAFTSAITQPLVIRQDCAFRLVSGQVTHKVPVFTAVATFGLNANGDATSCPGTGHYYCKVVWTGLAGNSRMVIFPY